MSCCQSHSSNGMAPAIGKLDAPKRNHYYFSKMMDVLQFEMEQSYHNDKRRLLNRLSVGTGVLCGLQVGASNGTLCVEPGVALDGLGREVMVPARYCIDPWQLRDDCGKPLRELPRDKAQQVTLCLSYRECLADLAPVLITDCRGERSCEAGSIVESFDLWIREGWPETGPGLCEALEKPLKEANSGYRVVARLELGGRPLGVAVAGSGRRALVINGAGKAPLQVIELATLALAAPLPAALIERPAGVCVAPDGGPVFVTHGDGLVLVDLDVDAPVPKVVLTDRAYGACAASHAGKRVFAINAKASVVEVIDVEAGKAKTLKLGKSPFDLAVSQDGSLLFVADNAEMTVTAVDTTTLKTLWREALDRPAGTIAGTGAGSARQGWSAGKGGLRRFDDAGAATDAAIDADPRDSAFTDDGSRHHLVHDADGKGNDEIIIVATDGLAPLARLPVGRGANGVAVVPKRKRALITALDGSVTVVDVMDLRERLCHALDGPCPPPKADCIPLATVELLADGTIGTVDACTHRTRLLSNETLLELILCLADKMESCCDGHATPVPTDPKPEEPTPEDPPPPTVAPFKVTGVSFIDMQGQPVSEMSSPSKLGGFKEANNVNGVRITFNRPVQKASIVTGGFGDDPATYSVLVTSNRSGQPLQAVAGTAELLDPTTLLYTITPDPRLFLRGDYTLTLFADPDPANKRPHLLADDGGRLDGEPIAFPSGNGVAGGDFTIKFKSQ